MRYPQFLPQNGTIGFIAPSYGFGIPKYAMQFESAKEQFKQLGFRWQLGPNCYESSGIGISNTPQLCAEEFNHFYAEISNDALIACGGGELMCEILPYVDFDMVRKMPPKWFMGYSDNTQLTLTLPTLCDVAVIYGPSAGAFGMQPWHQSLQDAVSLLTGQKLIMRGYDGWEYDSLRNEENPNCPYNITRPRKLVSYPEQNCSFEGRLLGGCMDCLSILVGTPFDRVKEFAETYRKDGIIWFLEACDLNTMSMRRVIWQMKQAGWFAHAKGFLIGRPYHYDEEMLGLNQYDAVLEPLKEFGVPVLMDIDLGHRPPMMPLIAGAYATVRTNGNDIEISHILR